MRAQLSQITSDVPGTMGLRINAQLSSRECGARISMGTQNEWGSKPMINNTLLCIPLSQWSPSDHLAPVALRATAAAAAAAAAAVRRRSRASNPHAVTAFDEPSVHSTLVNPRTSQQIGRRLINRLGGGSLVTLPRMQYRMKSAAPLSTARSGCARQQGRADRQPDLQVPPDQRRYIRPHRSSCRCATRN